MPDTAPVALRKVARTIRRVQMMQSHEPLLYVRSRAALLGAADKNADCACVYLIEKVLLLLVRVRVVDKGNLFFGNPALYELVL